MSKQRVPGKPGRKLKQARLRAGYTQAGLATELGVHLMTVSRAERNAQGISPSLRDRWLDACAAWGDRCQWGASR